MDPWVLPELGERGFVLIARSAHTRICHRDPIPFPVIEKSSKRWSEEEGCRADGADDDGVKNCWFLVGSPAEIANGLRKEARGGHWLRIWSICGGEGGIQSKLCIREVL